VVLAQDEATSAVWGMPGRVSEAGIANATLPLWGIAAALKQRVSAGRTTGLENMACAVPATTVRREITHGLL
jgi:two-component system chemotaxis response regulator CheB